MSVDLKEKSIALLSATTVSFAATGATTLYTVPAGKIAILFAAIVAPGADPVNCTCTIGSTGTSATSFLDTQTFHTNVDSSTEVGILQPIPAASTVAIKTYAAADVIQITIAGGGGGATNKVYLFGFLIDA